MPVYDDLGRRMKTFYEQIPKTKLMRRVPVAIRLDGKAFHSFTKGFQKPFDETLIQSMQATMKYLCENIQGCVLGYTQSDEITLILIDYQKLTSDAWFDYEVQKLCSISASMATMAFNRFFPLPSQGAMFDSRCFNIPKEEVTNLIYWRQLDATRNSIQMVGQAHFSHRELQNKSCNDIQDMLMQQKGINWNDIPTYQKRGSCCVREAVPIYRSDIWDKVPDAAEAARVRMVWMIDKDIPIFRGEGREYIEKRIDVGETT